VLGHVLLAGLAGVIHRVHRVPMRKLSVVTGGFMGPHLVMLCGFPMVMRCFFMMISRFLVVLGALVRSHGVLLPRWWAGVRHEAAPGCWRRCFAQ
jgi:hypothetical protein